MYTIEDIEMIRQKSGISYQEAVSLLDYHNGDVARALVDLEKHGKLKNDTENQTKRNEAGNMSEKVFGKETAHKGNVMNWLQKMYLFRLHVNKGSSSVINLSVLFCLACLIFAPHLTILAALLSLVLGYQFSISKEDTEFASDNLEKMVRNAAQNAKASVENVVRNFNAGNNAANKASAQKETVRTETAQAAPVQKEAAPEKANAAGTQPAADPNSEVVKELETQMDSFFEHNPAATTYRSAYSASAAQVPTLQIPVQVESSEGKMTIEEEQDGYHSATIE
ncbi:MAG: hypothetical protein IJG94_04060 [Clostridia bacterium]|nr:hypothetical protein [Clostridia bacterium]